MSSFVAFSSSLHIPCKLTVFCLLIPAVQGGQAARQHHLLPRGQQVRRRDRKVQKQNFGELSKLRLYIIIKVLTLTWEQETNESALGKLSNRKSNETWELVQSGDDPPPPP